MLTEVPFLFGAGAVGGVATSAGAIATLISYPALLAVGISPLAANVTNAVAVVGSAVGATLGSQPELRGTGDRLRQWSLLICGGAVAGAVLLLTTPAGVFAWVVSALIAAAAVLLLAQPRISAWRATRPAPTGVASLPFALVAVGVYNGYFGAASGIMTLAVLMLTVETRLVRANAVKNVLLGVADAVVAILFIIFGPIHWAAAIPLALGFLAGGSVGPAVARRVPPDALRVVIAVAALGLAVWLLVSAARG